MQHHGRKLAPERERERYRKGERPVGWCRLELLTKGKGKGMFLYSAVSIPLDRSKRFTSSPGRPVHSDTNSASLGSILVMQQLRNDYSLTCPPLSITMYSFIQLSRLRSREENENGQTSKR